ncbi:acyl-CoA synthetase (NDP forming) [Altererythrobacter atlanticus]|uniref:Succinyl-CoA ligase [ADP-forming] subunit beta n=1 Tax=Croceibacterium atlanticum TaxID=1267766 RepID=A0A0F7KYB7_9SPHN|nr:acetate--CoA ligase family protein [Croceibacterium atlanticum]AKH44241.1 Succinyl-CoA ligase [ADP-forming] subunit beta [Croceibacterium atlanticum]MBB5732552.1 acyl-CoA synthetase (NDP forming) [Croceibacterium atlanticum]
MSERRFTNEQIDRLLRPKSVAVIGASDRKGALGATLLNNLVQYEFDGDIYPVNPKRDELLGLKVYHTVDELPEGIDCAVLAIPRPFVLDTVRGLAARKCGAVVIYSAGFSEAGEEGMKEQLELGEIAREHGMVIEGPNCLGCTNYVERVPLTFVETNMQTPPKGTRAVGIASQSGALAAVLATALHPRGCYVSTSVSTGNEAASGVEDYVNWLVDDEDTHVIAMYVESLRRPKAFIEAARRARAAGKPIIMLHPGKSNKAQESAATHTGAMAGDYALMKTKLAREGVIFADTLEELEDITEIALRCPALPGANMAVLGESGALRGLAFDIAEDIGLDLIDLNDDNSPALRAVLPDFVPVSNPTDITAIGLSEPEIYTKVLTALLDDDRVGSVVASIIQSDPITSGIKFPHIIKVLEDGSFAKPLVFAGVDEGATVPQEYIDGLRKVGIPWFPSTERAYRAIARLADLAKRDLTDQSGEPLPLSGMAEVSGVVPEYKAKELLRPAGIAFPESKFAPSADEAAAVAETIGFPVVMKAQAAALGHKSDAGGVILNLKTADEVREAFTRMYDNVASYDSSITLDGVLVEKMGRMGTEMIVGAKSDPQWGPVVLAGFGGVTAEILKDVKLFTPDMGVERVKEGLLALKQAPILKGYRGSPELDVDALADLIVKIGQVMTGNPSIREIDLNPVIIHPKGDGVVALDALMLVD